MFLRERKTEILKLLKEQENFTIDRHNLAKFIKRFHETRSFQNKPKSGRPQKDVSDDLLNFIDKKMESNDETTSTMLQQILRDQMDLEFSVDKIKRIRRKLGWLSTGTKYCQLVKEVNRAKRFEFCQRCIDTGENFDNVIFTDQCTVAMEQHARITFHRWWEPPNQKGRPKHPYKVHIWAGISRRGATNIAVFTGIMESEFFVSEILKKHLEPFLALVYPDGHRFMQDNDPKHTSKRAKEYYREANINWWQTPPESPDLNPIELIWHELKHYLRVSVKPKTKEELVDGIVGFWGERITPEKCTTYIDHLKKVIPKVIEREGRASGY